MVEFFRDVLDGPLYIIITVLSIIFIMAIIGFIMERKKLEKEAQAKTVVVSTQEVVTPINPVTIQTEQNTPVTQVNSQIPIPNMIQEDMNTSNEVKPPIIVFEDPDQKKE